MYWTLMLHKELGQQTAASFLIHEKLDIRPASGFHAVLNCAHRYCPPKGSFIPQHSPVYQRRFPNGLKHAGSQILYLCSSLVR